MNLRQIATLFLGFVILVLTCLFPPVNRVRTIKVINESDGSEAVELPGPQGTFIAYVRGDSGVTASGTTNSDIYIAPIDTPVIQFGSIPASCMPSYTPA